MSGTGKAEAIRTIGGLLAVAFGLASITLVALIGMGFVKSDNPSVVSIATASFGVIGTVVGAYFGVKVGTDGTQKAVEALKGESVKAQVFAAHLDPAKAETALADIARLSPDVEGSGDSPAPQQGADRPADQPGQPG